MHQKEIGFQDAVSGLRAGDFSRLEPLFHPNPDHDGQRCRIIDWHEQGRFANEPAALAEALTCASFLGREEVVTYLLSQGVDATAGMGTGLNAFHWAANRGQLDVVKLFIRQQAPLEIRSMYGGTVLGTTVWAAIHEPRATHLEIIEELLRAGARLEEAGYPTGDARVDELLRRHGATA